MFLSCPSHPECSHASNPAVSAHMQKCSWLGQATGPPRARGWVPHSSCPSPGDSPVLVLVQVQRVSPGISVVGLASLLSVAVSERCGQAAAGVRLGPLDVAQLSLWEGYQFCPQCCPGERPRHPSHVHQEAQGSRRVPSLVGGGCAGSCRGLEENTAEPGRGGRATPHTTAISCWERW